MREIIKSQLGILMPIFKDVSGALKKLNTMTLDREKS
jgi:hypothetical protein